MSETTQQDPAPQARKFGHPGSGRRRQGYHTKGRQVEPAAVEEVRALLGDGATQRDLLIEYLHLIQDKYGHLSARHIAALAQEMRLAQTEIYEVATFYAHFDVVLEDETPPPPLTVRVCDSLSCALAGAERLIAELQGSAGDDVRILRAPCMGRCETAPVAEVGHNHLTSATTATVSAAISAGETHPATPDAQGLSEYQAKGGYALLQACLAGERSPEELIDILSDAGLRGMGGAGFPTGQKWKFVRAEAGPRLMAVNADEGEPGTFKDRYYLETEPHRVLEGMLVAAWAVEAEAVYFYLRDEYPQINALLTREIAALENAGLAAHTKIHLRRGAGAYICGEESAMIESIEGKRGLPRHRPPFVAQNGIFGQPTLVNNVETLYWIPEIISQGAQWFADQGRNGGKGLRSYSVSGHVRDPGVKLAPAGVTLLELVNEFCGGMAEGHTLKGYLPGGASGGILPAEKADLPLEFGVLEEFGSFVGSHAVVVLSDKDDMKAVALNLMRFFEDESCGQCTPCRVGTEKAVKLMQRDSWDQALLREVSDAMTDASICGLGQAAANPLFSLFRHFPDDLA
jgi:NADH:ubiquinone oxidoreductase subunit F (NADH-binding)/NADH:ubiquinone oxidoreductase subunit E